MAQAVQVQDIHIKINELIGQLNVELHSRCPQFSFTYKRTSWSGDSEIIILYTECNSV